MDRRVPAAAPRHLGAVISWVAAHSLAAFLLLVAIGSLRIMSTFHVLSHTSDEPAHIAAGLEWLSKGVYQYEPQHPPLARVAAALGPYLAGQRAGGNQNMWLEGLAVLYRNYDRNLALARLGILPFFWAASLVVFLWGKRYVGELGAVFAVLCFTFLPSILAHSGLATTDMALTATVSACFLAAMVWLERPSLARTLVFGATIGLAALSKFSALVFIPAALAATLIWYLAATRPHPAELFRRTKTYFLPLCGALLAASVVIWGGYRFSFDEIPIDTQQVSEAERFSVYPVATSSGPHVPAPEFFAGIEQVMHHNNRGHEAYLLGVHSDSGWWFYYFVVLAVKTPLPFLGLLLCGFILSVGRMNREIVPALAFSLGILLVASFVSNINIGVRHILPVYVGFSIVAGVGTAQLLERARTSRRAGGILAGLLLWLVATSALAHPDYLSYFNAIAANRPEEFLVDSDLDWGQDQKRLARRLREVNAPEVAFTRFFPDDLGAAGLPPVRPLNPEAPSPGWNAVNLTALKLWRFGLQGERAKRQLWPEQIKPTERVGKGIWLWYFPPSSIPDAPK